MDRKSLSIPEISLIGGTRAMLGAGLGLLLADRLSNEQRRAVGWTLFSIGIITTIPIVAALLGEHGNETSLPRPRRQAELFD